MTPLTIAVLAGGQSARMGENKALKIIGQKPLISHVIDSSETLSPLEIFTVYQYSSRLCVFGVSEWLETRFPDTAQLAGSSQPFIIAQAKLFSSLACDMPLIQPALLRLLIKAI